MNTLSRTITGMIFIVAGLVLIFLPFILQKNVGLIALIYGLPVLVIGIFILLNKAEDEIEQIKSKKKLKISTRSNLKNSNERRFKK